MFLELSILPSLTKKTSYLKPDNDSNILSDNLIILSSSLYIGIIIENIFILYHLFLCNK